LAAAIRLAASGHAVTVFESNATAGGKMAELQVGDFRFDMGPTVLTMPQYVDELFELCGEDPRTHFNYQRLDPVFRYFYADGTVMETPADTDRLVDELARKTDVDPNAVREFLARSKVKMELTDPVFLQRSLHDWRSYFDRPTWRGILNFDKIEAFTTMAKANARLFRNDKVAQLFNSYASYNGSDPYQAPATLNLISHYELTLGAYYPAGGMYALTTALAKLAERQGVRFRFQCPIERIMVQYGKAKGVMTAEGAEPFDVVVSNADAKSTFDRLMPDVRRPSWTLDRPRSSSVIVFFWAMDGEHSDLHVHNMFMSNDPKEEYRHIFSLQDVCDDPTVYVSVSSKMNRADAPLGCENWFVMVSVPHDSGQDWDALVAKTRTNVLSKLQQHLGGDLEERILKEEVMDPRDIAQRTSSAMGAVFGNSSNDMFAAFLRHPNFSRQVRDLYFCGGSVHPGSGIPLCLLSAKIMSGLVNRN
jgi:phytoene desaturase